MIGKTNTDLGTLDPAIVLGFTVTSYSGTYDGAYHSITASVSSAYASSTRIQYSLNNSSWTTTNPTRINAGTYTIYVRAINSNVGTVTSSGTITITPAPVTLTADSLTTTYNKYGNAQTVNTYKCSVSGVNFPSTVKASGSGTNVGTYPVTFSGATIDTTTDATGNYVVHELIEGTITINKAVASELGLYVYDYTGDYDGSAHTVTATVSITSGTTIQYSTDNSTWSSTAPTRNVIGSTTVYVRAVNSNFNTATATGTITINRAVATLIISWATGLYCTAYDPNNNKLFNMNTSGYWSGNPTMTGTYTAICAGADPMYRTVNVTSTTSGTYTIAW